MISVPDNLNSIRDRMVAVAELEAVGLSVRTINMLEESLNIIWLDELLQYTQDELKDNVPNLGDKTLEEIVASVHRFCQIDQAKQRLADRQRGDSR